MAISVDQIDYWRSLPTETEVLEFKEAKNQYDTDKLYEYCVAIANEGGGHFLLGIRNTPPRMVVGTKAIDNPGAMAQKIFEKLGFRVHIEEVFHPHGRVVAVKIPSRPKGQPHHVDGAYMMRCGESLQAMSPEVIRGIVMEGEPDWLSEPAMEKVGQSRVLEVLDTLVYFQMLGVTSPSASAIIERFIGEKFLIDMGGGSYTITRLGALLFAKQLSTFPDLSFKAPRVIVYSGISKLTRPTSDTLGTFGYVVGFQGLLRDVMNHLPYEEVIVEGLRRNVSLVPEIVVRELLANALIHQEFTMQGSSVLVEIYKNRIEISNPGEPMVPIDRLIDGIRSRNERFADFMRRIGICERRGSGIDRVVDAAESFNLPAPDFRAMNHRTLSIAYGPRSFDNMDRTERIRACYQHCALKWEISERMTNQSLRERFHLREKKSSVVSQVIAAAIEIGVIKLDEKAGLSKKFARYVPFWV